MINKSVIKRLLVVILCLSLLLQTGCWDLKIYERIGFILQVGIEYDKGKKDILYTVTLPVVSKDIEQKVEILSTKVDLLREGRDKVSIISGKQLEGGKIQHILFSEELAADGVAKYLDVFVRASENPMLCNLVVIEGSPCTMLQTSIKYKDKPRPAYYINDLLNDARRTSYAPETRIYNFMTLYYSETIDPIMPTIFYDEKGYRVTGSALFNRDKMVGKIDTSDTTLLLALIGTNKNVSYIYKENESGDVRDTGVKAAVMVKKAERKIKIDLVNNQPEINIKLNFNATTPEYIGPEDLDNIDAEKKFKEAVEKAMKQKIAKLLKKLQDVGSDPIGFGEIIRSKYNKYWQTNDWKKVYKNVKINFELKINFEYYGTIK